MRALNLELGAAPVWRRRALISVGYLALYAVGLLSERSLQTADHLSLWIPGGALALGLFLKFGARWLPVAIVVRLGLLMLIASPHPSLASAAVSSIGTAATFAAFAAALRRLVVRFDRASMTDAAWFLLVAVALAPGAAGLFAIVVPHALGLAHTPRELRSFWDYWLGEATAIAVLLPLGMSFAPRTALRALRNPPVDSLVLPVAEVLTGAGLALTLAVSVDGGAVRYLCLVPLWYAAARGGHRASTRVAAVMALCVSIGARTDHLTQAAAESAQLFMLVLAVLGLLAGVRESERRATQARLAIQERLLRDSEAEFRFLAEQSTDMISRLDTEGRCVYASPSTLTLLGYAPEELMDAPGGSLMHPDDAAALAIGDPGTLTQISADVRQITGRLRHRNGEWIWAEAVHRTVRDPDTGLATGAITAARDITARKRNEAELRHANRALELARDEAAAASAAKTTFVASMSHEIRTPLNGVIGMTSALLQTELDDRQKEYAETARSCGEALLSVVDEVLDFAKIDAGKLTVEPLPMDLRQLLVDTLTVAASTVGDRPVRLSSHVAEALPRVIVTDPQRLRQIVTNLLGNAVKFTERGAVRLTAEMSFSGLEIRVTDTGIGISPEALRRLFTPFEQADSSTTRRFGGTGLGLAISAQLAELLGGSLGATSELGTGSTFTLTLPASVVTQDLGSGLGAPTDQPAGWVASTSAPRGPLRVLVAEDNRVNQRVAVLLLEELGHHVTVASNGAKAVRAATSEPFDVVLMDCQMPVLDGYDATRAIRQTAGLEDLPIIALTAAASNADRERCLEAGMTGYLTKPIRPGDLSAALGAVVAVAPAATGDAVDATAEDVLPVASGPEPTPSFAALDDDAVERLRALVRRGRGEAVDELIDCLIDDARSSLTSIIEATAAGDHKQVAFIAHRLRGSALTFGAAALGAKSTDLERAAPTAIDLTDRVAALSRTADLTVAALQELRDSLQADALADRP